MADKLINKRSQACRKDPGSTLAEIDPGIVIGLTMEGNKALRIKQV